MGVDCAMMDDEEKQVEIYDDNPGIRLTIWIIPGISINIHMDDEQAETMISIIQNKLNARI